MASAALTQYSPAGGCGCKMQQQTLDSVVSSLRDSIRASAGLPELLVGLANPDDAAVFDAAGLADESLVFTCDFQTPVVDDPTDWGRIAAVNALSDVYAMGGRPLLALNLLCWPADLEMQLMLDVLTGGAEAVAASGALLVGGHSITDPSPKYGLAVVGRVDPQRLLLKGGARDGDRLILTKPLGVGVVGTAIKQRKATPGQVRAAVEVMTRSNAAASGIAVGAGLCGGTDVTGFGLIGHLHEMTTSAALSAEVWTSQVPRLDFVSSLIEAGCAPDGTHRNLSHALAGGWLRPGDVTLPEQLVLADAQTSGGLLLAAPPGIAADIVSDLKARGDLAAAQIGEFHRGEPGVVALIQDQRRGDQ